MNTANAVGLSDRRAGRGADRGAVRRQARLPAAGVLLTAASLLATGLGSDYAVLALLRAVAGAAGALSLITGGALAAAAGGGGGHGRPTLALGVYFGGAGFGMVVSAFAVPALVAAVGWRSGWFVLGALGCWATRCGAAGAGARADRGGARAHGGRRRSARTRRAGCAR